MIFLWTVTALCLSYGIASVLGYDASRSDNLVVYYGQNSYGATHGSDTANWQKTLSTYCQDDAINAIPLAFVNVFFSVGGLPEINMANTCNPTDSGVFTGTNLANCQFLGSDIKACQAKGKIITLSLGGATGAAGFTSDSQAEAFADTIWNLFLGGSSSTRPFGDAVLDGIDLDIEGGSSTGFVAFITRIRSHASGASKQYYITAAPQCPFPDAYLGSIISAVGFDAIYVQFYNNYCSVASYPTNWNFADWDDWAKNTSPNKNVKIFVGAPASSTAATSGYATASTLINIATTMRSQYSSFGGVMLWDASQAYANGRFDLTIKNGISTGGGETTTSKTTSSTATTSSSSSTQTTTSAGGGSGSCTSVSAWQSTVAYTAGSQVNYNGRLWTAKWWTYGDIPGGAAGVWTDNGACSALTPATVKASSKSAVPAIATSSVKVTSVAKTIASATEATVAQNQAKVTVAVTSDKASERRNSRIFRL